MRLLRQRLGLVVFAFAAVLAACHAGGDVTPPAGSQPGPVAGAAMSAAATQAFERLGIRVPMAGLPLCSAPAAALPGSYVALVAAGNVRLGTFTANPTRSFWVLAQYAQASPPPSTSPSASPTALPSPPVPAYIYYGTYALKKTQTTGCAYLLATVSHKPLPPTHFNAAEIDAPNFQTWITVVNVANRGYLYSKITNLSASGGTGSLTLKTFSTGATFDSGTIALTGRVQVQADSLLRAIPILLVAVLAACAGGGRGGDFSGDALPALHRLKAATAANGRAWYVSTAGRDEASCGTARHACATITYVDAHKVAPGDVVYVTGSFALTPKTCILTSTSGRPGAPITYVAQPAGSAKIDGRAACFYVWRDKGDFVRVYGFDFTGAQKNSNVNEGTIVYLADAPGGHTEFAYNVVHDLPWQIGAAVDMAPFGPSNYTGAPCSVHDNVFHDIALGKPRSVILGGYALYIACGTDTQVYNNLIYREGDIGIHCWHAANNLHIYNNTIHGARIGIMVGTGDDGYVKNAYYDVSNNVITHAQFSIFAEANSPGTISGRSRFSHNLLYEDAVNWRFDDHGRDTTITATMHVEGTILADPKFRSATTYNFRLQPSSPAIDAGQSAGAPDHDLDGYPRPYGKGYDAGAYEWHP